jgi:hypothetical protein
MDPSVLFNTQHLFSSVIAILFVQLIIKVFDLYSKHIIKKDAKRDLDIKRAFKALRLISGEKWAQIREEIMRDEKID